MEPVTMIDKRIEFMLSSPTAEDTIIRNASFLKPIIPLGTKEPLSHLPTYSFPSLPLNFDPREWSFEVSFPSWVTRTHAAWNSWVDGMVLEHQDLWKAAGVYEPILSSKCRINRDTRLVYGLAEKWCTETNTFIFKWGETTLTLEDVMILGGFSILGDSIVSYTLDPEEVHIEKYLDDARKQFNKTTAKRPNTSLWMKRFKATQSEYEHQAFLAYWLSRYVFSSLVIEKRAITLAVHLGSGRRLDLASAVLSNIYRDLTLLKLEIINPRKKRIVIKSPFQLVQVWAWERFPKLSPEPRPIDSAVLRLARWDRVIGVQQVENWREALDSVLEADFKWRPYTNKVYLENEKTVVVDSSLDYDSLTFVTCLAMRKDGLIGFDSKEIYRPHHVAKQFGYDQDLPYTIMQAASDEPDVHSGNMTLYIPDRNSKGGVSLRYSNWWKQSILGNNSPVPPGFPPK